MNGRTEQRLPGAARPGGGQQPGQQGAGQGGGQQGSGQQGGGQQGQARPLSGWAQAVQAASRSARRTARAATSAAAGAARTAAGRAGPQGEDRELFDDERQPPSASSRSRSRATSTSRDEGYGFIRVNNYLASKSDSYVPVKLSRQYGLRQGDHVAAMSRPAGRNEKNPAVLEILSVNGAARTTPGAAALRGPHRAVPRQRLRWRTRPIRPT